MTAQDKARRWTISRRAAADLVDIGTYTEELWGREQRRRYLALIEKGFDALLERPLSGKDFSYVRSGYRRASVGEHFVFYRLPQGNGITIIRVLHQKRDVVRHLVEDEHDEA